MSLGAAVVFVEKGGGGHRLTWEAQQSVDSDVEAAGSIDRCVPLESRCPGM